LKTTTRTDLKNKFNTLKEILARRNFGGSTNPPNSGKNQNWREDVLFSL